MAVQQEIKSQLAKLLATEDLVVEHKQVETAQFNVQTRVLTLPVWDKASNVVYDMLVGHEVGHALFTPDEDWTEKVKIPQQFVNVCEDVRIEKLMKRKYMGIAKTFYRGYNELNDKDFFQVEDEDITKFNLADRVNLFYKVGSFVDLAFSDTEKKIVDLIGSTESFDQMLDAAVTLYDYCKQQQEQEQKVANIDAHNEEKQEQLNMDFPKPTDEDGEKEESEGNAQSPQMDKSGDDVGDLPEQQEYEPEVQTADSLQDSLQSLVNKNGEDSVYVEIPKLYLDKVIIDNAEIHQEIDISFREQQERATEILAQEGLSKNLYEEADGEYVKFKRDAQKEVNYLVKEFECRKAADSYARATTSRTGILDTTKLHTYRFNEDLFKKITVLPDGKNHGLVFVLDWSGSMAHVMLDTIKQLYNLVWFCRKVNIPFEVYAFTQEWQRAGMESYERSAFKNELYDRKENLLQIDDTFSLMNFFTSKVNVKTLEHQMLNIFRIAMAFSRDYQSYYSYPEKVRLSGTPLNESLVALHQILPRFQRENKLQKVQCIILTDGEANHLPYHKMVKRNYRYMQSEEESYLGCRRLNPQTSFLRDRKCGKTYTFGYDYHDFTDTLLTNLKDRFPTVNFIGMRLLANRDALRFAKCYHPEYSKEYKTIQTNWRKQKSFIINNSGYDAYFALSSSNLADDAEFEVQDDATKAQIKRAFVKSLKTKKLNKKVLGEFIQLVA